MSATWKTLKANDTVRIIAPAANSPDKEDLARCCDFLRSLSLQPVYSDSIFAEHVSYYNFANTEQKRYDDFVNAIESDAAAIWCFRGGYGCDRVLRLVVANKLPKPKQHKLFLGFSDITNLHSYMNTQWHWQTVHAPALRQLGNYSVVKEDVDALTDYIFGRHKLDLKLTGANDLARKAQEITAEISGGNLTTLQCAIGTPWEAPTANKILLLEDIGEAPYRISRMFQQLLNNGMARATKAILLGEFIHADNMEQVIREFAEICEVPVLRTNRIGHGKSNFPLPLGVPGKLCLGDNPVLSF